MKGTLPSQALLFSLRPHQLFPKIGKIVIWTRWSGAHWLGHVLQVVRSLCLKDSNQVWCYPLFLPIQGMAPRAGQLPSPVWLWKDSGSVPQAWRMGLSSWEKRAGGLLYLGVNPKPTPSSVLVFVCFWENNQNRLFSHNHVVICFTFYCCSKYYIDSGLRTSR